MSKDGDQIKQHHALAMGHDIGHGQSRPTESDRGEEPSKPSAGFSHGGSMEHVHDHVGHRGDGEHEHGSHGHEHMHRHHPSHHHGGHEHMHSHFPHEHRGGHEFHHDEGTSRHKA